MGFSGYPGALKKKKRAWASFFTGQGGHPRIFHFCHLPLRGPVVPSLISGQSGFFKSWEGCLQKKCEWTYFSLAWRGGAQLSTFVTSAGGSDNSASYQVGKVGFYG